MESFEFEQQVLFCVNYVLCLSCFNFLCWFIAALWSPAGKELTYWLLFVMFNCIFVTFPCSVLGQVWHLIVSIPDLCRLSNFDIHPGFIAKEWG